METIISPLDDKDWYIKKELIIEPTRIYYNMPVAIMMDWEHPLMSASAAYVCKGGGDILEVGFGMGISAGYIQSHSISSHTIIENHPQIIPLAQEWAKNKPNVTIISGSWYDVYKANKLSTYNGVFFDPHNDGTFVHFSSSLSSWVKPGGRATWWNEFPTGSVGGHSGNIYNIPNVEYDVIEVSQSGDKLQHQYFAPPEYRLNNSNYWLPKKQF